MKKAYTFIEIMAVMMIIGFLFVVTAFHLSNVGANNSLARFKKGYASVESAVSSLVSDSNIYGSRLGFKDTQKAELKLYKDGDPNNEGTSLGEVLGENPKAKFRDSFKYFLNVIKDNIDCDIYKGSSSSGCFMTDDGVVFGIPNTDFVSNMLTITDSDGDKVKVMPITMYVNYDGTKKDPENDAFIIGVEYDGNLHFIETVNKSLCAGKKQPVQCYLKEYANSKTIGIFDEELRE